ncbi:MAG: DUF4440 domain-containing protein [Bacteroidota bacterium]
MRIQFGALIGLLICCYACEINRTTMTSENSALSASELTDLKPIIKERGTTWGKALTTKNIKLLEGLYDDNAHYLPNDAAALHGKAAILAYWKASFDFLGDLQLNMESLEGNAGLVYETGNGAVKVMDENGQFFDMPFKYVNVWKRQADGEWKVVIDIFNDLPNE